ncbi:MAG: O-antigen ligase family protein [Bacteroidales bacterium]|nr:O-antigen ligase family protein [Bacteroidales bacterium]
MRWFGFCFIAGCLLLFFVKTAQLVYCFNYFWPYFKIHYVDAGVTYMGTGSGFLYALNEFLSNQNIYFSWAFLRPVMHTTIEALIFNLAFALLFITLIKKDPWLNTWFKKSLAFVVLLLFALVLLTSNSKIGQFLFVVNLLLMLVFCFRQKRWITAGVLVSLFLLFGSVGLHYFGMGVLGRFAHSVDVMEGIKDHKEFANDGSLLPRLCAWNTALEMAKEKPVFGFGASFMKDFVARCTPERYPSLQKAYYHPHNQFLSVLVSNGIVGLCVFLLFWVQAVRLVWKNRRLWGWIWLITLFTFCCSEVFLINISFTYVCLPYCFLMVEYHNCKIVNSRHIPSV